jgi:hypothetical protein
LNYRIPASKGNPIAYSPELGGKSLAPGGSGQSNAEGCRKTTHTDFAKESTEQTSCSLHQRVPNNGYVRTHASIGAKQNTADNKYKRNCISSSFASFCFEAVAEKNLLKLHWLSFGSSASRIWGRNRCK